MIKVENLSKAYGAMSAVRDVSFHCGPGTVTGFLGPNGAGKSTTLRMLCGLSKPSSGTAFIAGQPYRRLANPAQVVGIMIDASAAHGGRTGQETLRIAAMTMGADRHQVPVMLDRVGLPKAAASRRVRAYSLGMRQRLGVAQALLGNPKVLILDEPANGLDPEGIAWMRGLLRGFADRGGTVLLSSHLLSEVEALADRFVMIGNGTVVAEGSKTELLGSSGTLVRARDPHALRSALCAAGLTFVDGADGELRVSAEPSVVGQVAADTGVALTGLGPTIGGLEKLFFTLTATADPSTSMKKEISA